ncbi:PREDICTED: serine/arginine-rich SC35-like splicing factor SCL28 isoform X1 [Lupinus angustifolius]|uniref:serine/arginine-rich SC35-like splicing factor SCL28 isoform X1 n=1 Tax=Lupinus angustifolius TaxID=3871 RepID=UPI00092F1BE9|nr:PREDICTED: serine/arginine-rich SC35-like splicing factor SCL28 isoform X1 [Lupinus angustifolius]
MARYRSRSRSYSPRRRSPTPPRRDSRSHRDRRSPLPSGLLVRNLPLDARPEDLWGPFERFGPVKDVYLPKNYYTGEPRGFGFVKYRYGEDAAEAKQQLDHTIIGGREIRIVFAEENRKTPQEMRVTTRGSDRHGGGRKRHRSRSRTPRRRYHSYSRSPSPARESSRFEFDCFIAHVIRYSHVAYFLFILLDYLSSWVSVSFLNYCLSFIIVMTAFQSIKVQFYNQDSRIQKIIQFYKHRVFMLRRGCLCYRRNNRLPLISKLSGMMLESSCVCILQVNDVLMRF